MKRSDLVQVFGERALDDAIFYGDPGALRFELSCGEVIHGHARIDLFTRAYDRARAIVRRAFAKSSRLAIVFAYFLEGLFETEARFLRALKRCDLPYASPDDTWMAPVNPDDPDAAERKFILFEGGTELLDRLLWAALGKEQGIRPSMTFSAHVYIADLDVGILANPYDDRGMDIVGPNRELLRQLYLEFSDYLLPYHRARMDEFYKRERRDHSRNGAD